MRIQVCFASARHVVTAFAFASLAFACSSSNEGTGSPAPTPDGGKEGGSPSKLGGALGGGKTEKDAGKGAEDPEPTPGGGTTCRVAAICIGECADGDDACVQQCVAGMSDAELGELQELATCISNSGCEDDECIQNTCSAEITACVSE